MHQKDLDVDMDMDVDPSGWVLPPGHPAAPTSHLEVMPLVFVGEACNSGAAAIAATTTAAVFPVTVLLEAVGYTGTPIVVAATFVQIALDDLPEPSDTPQPA